MPEFSMAAHITWTERSLMAYRLIKSEKRPYTVPFSGRKLLVLPGVVSPKYTADSFLYSKYLPKIVKRSRFLEIGTGTGVAAIACALAGARVVATDINRVAVRNCRANAKRYGVRIDARSGSVFSPIRNTERFDYIYWNHPWNYSSNIVRNTLLKGAFDYKYRSTERFIVGARRLLASGGAVLIGTVNIAGTVRRIRRLAVKYDYSIKTVKRIKKRLPEPEGVFTMDLVVLELRPKKHF